MWWLRQARTLKGNCTCHRNTGIRTSPSGGLLDHLAWLRHFTGMTLSGFPRIAVDPAVCGGRPVVAGTRVRVTDILEMLAGGASTAEILTDFPYLSEEDVRAALSYAAAN